MAAAVGAADCASPVGALVHAGRVVLRVAGAAAVLMSDDGSGRVEGEDGDHAGAMVRLQFDLGEGPSFDAHRTGEALAVADLAATDGELWPALVRAAPPSVRSVYVVPLQIGGVRLGVLWTHRDRPGHWTVGEYRDAQAVAELLVTAILDARPVGEAVGREDFHGAVVHQATGMMAARLGVGLDEALARLRATAFAEDRSLYDLCRDVVARRDRPAP